MKSKIKTRMIFFDTGPIISLVLSRLVFILPLLKEHFGGKFYITPAVRRELVERPLQVKRFEFEALEVIKLIREGVLEVYENIPVKKVNEMIKDANSSFMIGKKTIDLIQSGEIESVVSALDHESATVVMDERTLRLFIEDSSKMKSLLEHRFHREVVSVPEKMNRFSGALKRITIIRSIELAGVAYKLGFLDSYIPKIKNGKKTLLDAVLWTAKFSGCAVTGPEIEEIKDYLLT